MDDHGSVNDLAGSAAAVSMNRVSPDKYSGADGLARNSVKNVEESSRHSLAMVLLILAAPKLMFAYRSVLGFTECVKSYRPATCLPCSMGAKLLPKTK